MAGKYFGNFTILNGNSTALILVTLVQFQLPTYKRLLVALSVAIPSIRRMKAATAEKVPFHSRRQRDVSHSAGGVGSPKRLVNGVRRLVVSLIFQFQAIRASMCPKKICKICLDFSKNFPGVHLEPKSVPYKLSLIPDTSLSLASDLQRIMS